MEIVEGQTFEGKRVSIDGKRFIHCTFVECTMEYRGGAVAFERSQMSKCRHVFFGRARRTLHYLQSVGLMPYDPRDWGELSDSVH